jgi:hypothetical protein
MKIELDLPDKPEVHYMAGVLNVDPLVVVGGLVKVWAWFNKHTSNGDAHGVTLALVDRITSVTGFGEAMTLAGWLEQHDKTLHMPKFDRHTSESAKKRALTARRNSEMRRSRDAKSDADRDAHSVTKSQPREEKRRDKYTQLPEEWKPKDSTVDKLSREFGLRVPEDVNRYVAAFRDACQAKGYRYADFDAAFRNCVRQDWPKLRDKAGKVVTLQTEKRVAI